MNQLVDTQANTLVIHSRPGVGTLSFPARLVLENNTDVSKLGLILVNDMQTLSSEVVKLEFWSKKMRNVLKSMKKQFSDF